jgi:hypothetical protein
VSVFTNSASTSKEEAKAYTAAVLGLVGDAEPVPILRATAAKLRELVDRVAIDAIATHEAPGKWSIRQVIQHLADSEVVFAWRLRMILSHDRPEITGYDQDLWAQRLGYDDADAAEALETFTALRRANLRLLTRASAEDLARYGVHAERGNESVAHMMRMYAGHDTLHLRQIERIGGVVAP